MTPLFSSSELILQKLGFGAVSDTVILVRCLEAIFFLMQADFNQELLKWTETITEAFFLQLSVFGGQSAGDALVDEEMRYAEDLIERI